ncbi:DNA helicase [Malassezia psittaci]|uniref:ATP-dependent DNA helicase n=1 Tax=Malassezia psittaci TaxID=1821823 RepID=A0AAF0FF34_9BASI|nr:DNA helicase [Malassezia psittaci]
MAQVDAEFDEEFDSSLLAQIDAIEAKHVLQDLDWSSNPSLDQMLGRAFDEMEGHGVQNATTFSPLSPCRQRATNFATPRSLNNPRSALTPRTMNQKQGTTNTAHSVSNGIASKGSLPLQSHGIAVHPARLQERSTQNSRIPSSPRFSLHGSSSQQSETYSGRNPTHSSSTQSTRSSRSRSSANSSSQNLTQQGLWGHSIAPAAVESSQGSLSVAPNPPSSSTGGFAWATTKVWDHTVFQQGNRVMKKTADDQDEVSDPHYRRPPQHSLPAPPSQLESKVEVDCAAAQTWIYPVNKPLRSYQLNIVQKALFHNVLVALPTGLGKTFIAAVVILNMFRWFPQGKMTQQQQACHSICGLPWDTAIELTGSTRRSLRDDEWLSKRIFYMTPQTFENDLLSTTCDPRDVVCVVVDEAHRATGNYAYCKVIRHLMYYNPHFRVLALTATPGSHADKVQEVVDNLHINRIEIRTEEALDIQPYLHTKHEQLVRVPLGESVEQLRVAWIALMRVFHEPLLKHGVMRQADTGALRSFAVRSAAADANGRAILADKPYLRGSLAQLASMALALQYLSEESVRVFCDRAQSIVSPSKTATKKNQVFSTKNPAFQAFVMAMESVESDKTHPKIHALQNILRSHFQAHQDTRVMIFCSYREVVTEIVESLQAEQIKATPFIGQATDKKGNRGFTQKVQEQILRDFQKGIFQVLVATSIGEEGLDIGEVDLIVCYEAVRDSVRALQRVGRTGRQRDGRIVVLMTEGREEQSWQHSKDSYKSVQKLVRSANVIELYTDVDRLIPAKIKPEPIMCEVEQPAFDPRPLQQKPTPRSASKKDTTRKSQSKPKKPRLSQQNTLTFCSANTLRRTQRDEHREDDGDEQVNAHPNSPIETLNTRGKSKQIANLSDDSDDAEIASGLHISSTSSAYSWPTSSIGDKSLAANSSISKPAVQLQGCSTPQKSIVNSGAPQSGTRTLGTRRVPLANFRCADSMHANNAISSIHDSLHSQNWPGDTLNASSTSPSMSREEPSSLHRFSPHPLVAQLAELDSGSAVADASDASIPCNAAADDSLRPGDKDCTPLFFLSQESDVSARVPSENMPRMTSPEASPMIVATGHASPSLRVASSPKRTESRPGKRRRNTDRRWFLDQEAERETDSEVHGESDEDDSGFGSSEEDDQDRAAVGDFSATQQEGYNQQSIYLQSLLSQQAPTPFRGRDRLKQLLARRNALRPSSEADENLSDAYSQDSFVVGDDEVSWADSSEPF